MSRLNRKNSIMSGAFSIISRTFRFLKAIKPIASAQRSVLSRKKGFVSGTMRLVRGVTTRESFKALLYGARISNVRGKRRS